MSRLGYAESYTPTIFLILNELHSGTSDVTTVGESGDGQAVVNTVTAESSTAINAYNDGGTMYFYSGDEMVRKNVQIVLKFKTKFSLYIMILDLLVLNDHKCLYVHFNNYNRILR